MNEKIEYVNRTFHCEFPKFEEYEKRLNWTDNTLIGAQKPCKSEGFCFWKMTNRFCTPPFCSTNP